MLQKSRRLTSSEVASVLKSGKSLSAGPIRLKYKQREDGARVSRFAVIVSKKVVKAAVGRNRLRRRVFALLQESYPKEPFDVLIFILTGDIQTKGVHKSLTESFAHMRRTGA